MAGIAHPFKELESAERHLEGKLLIGKVVDNNDPEKMERVRIRIPELYENVADGDLPWSIPERSSLQGSTASVGSFGVPVVGSVMYVRLQGGDPHFPVYVGAGTVKSTEMQIPKTNYPFRYGYVDHWGNQFWADTKTGDMWIVPQDRNLNSCAPQWRRIRERLR